MTPAQEQLWQKIQSFNLDNPQVQFKFTDRLARENGWQSAYAKRVVNEYKKFIFMCCTTATGVTPSDPVDQAWHLHLTFTQSYWNDMCRDTLGQQVHHNPTKGGQAEAQKFDGYYTHTHQLYADMFGVQPPADIWQNNQTRFTDINFRRVNVGRYWLVPKPSSKSQLAILFLLMIAIGLFIQASETAIAVVIMIGIIILVGFAVYKGDDWSSGDGSDGGSGCGGDGHNGGHSGHGDHGGGDSGCGSGCSGCSSSGCSGCGGGGH